MTRTRRLTRGAILLGTVATLAVPTVAWAAGGPPSGTGGGRGGETTIANSLSNPVVFADQVGILGAPAVATQTWPTATWTGLRIPDPTTGSYSQSAVWTLPDNTQVTVWPQALPGNAWQASWVSHSGPAVGTLADWGDNILPTNATPKTFSLKSAIRVEMKLTPVAPQTGLTGYYQKMISNGLSGTAEKWAAAQPSLSPIDSTVVPTVFTGGAAMRLERVTDKTGATLDPSFAAIDYPVSVTFVPADAEDSGTTGGSAPMRLAGEINASGNAVYGLNLFPAQIPAMSPGYYKLSFSVAGSFVDNAANGATYTSGATLDGVTSATAEGGTAAYDAATHTTSVVFQITSAQSGRRGGGGGGGGGE